MPGQGEGPPLARAARPAYQGSERAFDRTVHPNCRTRPPGQCAAWPPGFHGGEDGNYHLDILADLAPRRRWLPCPTSSSPARTCRTSRSTATARRIRWRTLALVTLVTGVAAFALGFIVAAHLPAAVLGVVALLVGMYVQLISATREERIIIMTGVVAAFVGAGLGFAHGGFSV